MKVCGVTRVQDAAYAARLGAWAVGVILYSPSQRAVTPRQAQAIFEVLPPTVMSVAVSDTQYVEDLEQILALSPDALQLYHPFTFPDDRSFRVFRSCSADGAIPLDCDALVIDESHGSGRRYNSAFARRMVQGSSMPVILSGGLSPDTVAAAIQECHPFAVDVSSGVESSCGGKDPMLMRRFFQACREAVP